MLKPFDAGFMQRYEVSRAVGNVKNDTEDLIRPIA
jgi:hypothetical protein